MEELIYQILAIVLGSGLVGSVYKWWKEHGEALIEAAKAQKYVTAFTEAIAIFDYIDSDNTTVTTKPETTSELTETILEDRPALTEVYPDQLKEIFMNLDATEIKSLQKIIDDYEEAGTLTFTLKTSKGTYELENGYILTRPMDIILDAEGWRVGHLTIDPCFYTSENSDVILDEFDPANNEIVIKGEWDNFGATIIGLQVDDENIQIKGLRSSNSQEYKTKQVLTFQLWDYNKTVDDQKVNIKIMQGFRRKDDLGHPIAWWTEIVGEYTMPVKARVVD